MSKKFYIKFFRENNENEKNKETFIIDIDKTLEENGIKEETEMALYYDFESAKCNLLNIKPQNF